ncbi:MAG TPA: MBL fold metallo-hydrolase [Vicinamibacterales bacterium]|nr:MBL fold metallo-hydrolase [Vicinamibacterales bacterium]
MRLTAFQSDKGDCLLLTDTAGTRHILVDGGMSVSYNAHVAAAMGKLAATKKALDVVYVSHIDQDHIGGVLKMLDDEAAWRVHEFQKNKNKNKKSKPPTVPRPPKVREIWHNAFHEQLKKNAGPIEEALAAVAPILAGSDLDKIRDEALRQSELITSIGEAIRVSRRVSDNQLNIPLNPRSDGKLMMLRKDQKPIKLGDLTITVIGPTAAHLEQLQEEWNTWLRSTKGKAQLKKLQDAARRDEERLGASEFDTLTASLRLQAESFGDPSEVTAPNLASLTLLVEDGATSVLLTGDARGDQIVDGLKSAGRLNGETMEVDVLKVPHHGSENNIDSDFVETVLARDYVFCGNGFSGNPNTDVIEMMFRRRLAASAQPFRFWFNSSKAVADKPKHMAAVETLVKKLAKNGKGRFSFTFLTKGSSIKIL